MARAYPRGLVRRKPLANLRADEQEHHMRRRLEVSWHKTTKPRDLMATVNDAAVQRKCISLSGGLRHEKANSQTQLVSTWMGKLFSHC